MSDEAKLSRRGFLGMLAAIGAALNVVGSDGVVRVAGLNVEELVLGQPAGGGHYRVKIDGTGTPDTFTWSLIGSAQ